MLRVYATPPRYYLYTLMMSAAATMLIIFTVDVIAAVDDTHDAEALIFA